MELSTKYARKIKLENNMLREASPERRHTAWFPSYIRDKRKLISLRGKRDRD